MAAPTNKYIDVWADFGRLRRIYYSPLGEIWPQPPGELLGNSARLMPTGMELARPAAYRKPAAWWLYWRELDRTAYREIPNPLRLVRAGETTQEAFWDFFRTVREALFEEDRP